MLHGNCFCCHFFVCFLFCYCSQLQLSPPIPLTEIGGEGTGAMRRGESAVPRVLLSQDVHIVPIIQDGAGKDQHNAGA